MAYNLDKDRQGIRFGVCCETVKITDAFSAGFDYFEAGLAWEWNADGELPPDLAAAIPAAPLRPEVCNGFLPSGLKVVGPEIDPARQDAYLARAFARAARFGVDLVVFGSGGARRIPEGYPVQTAWQELVDYTWRAGEAAARFGIRLAIEPLNSRECNLITSVSEAVRLAEAVDHPAVGVLADLYHIRRDGQPLTDIENAGERLWHVHVAMGTERRAPQPGDEAALIPFFQILKAMGYRGRISVEAGWGDFAAQAAGARQTLRRAWDQA